MSDFLQLHLLTAYPPANLNRDDTGRPKTAVFGGATRLRVSSQSLKRAWRSSDVFRNGLDGYMGSRTQRLGSNIALALTSEFGLGHDEANALARVLAAVFGKLETKTGKELFTKQLAFISPTEQSKLRAFLKHALSDEQLRARLRAASSEVALDPEDETDEPPAEKPKKAKKQSKATTKLIKEISAEILTVADTAVDIAMFGRMLADNPAFNREAAVQVAHAITTHRVTVEDDYYTAVDDLKKREEDAGAGFVGEQAFGAGVFYLYICVDRSLLVSNLGGGAEGRELGAKAIASLVEAAATVGPRGKRASFASHARAQYILAERGTAQPRTLGAAFLSPIGAGGENDFMQASINALQKLRDGFDAAYGNVGVSHMAMQVGADGSLPGIISFTTADMPGGTAPRHDAA
jgi:CRISPR system Cascade subunit CasC